MKRIALALLTLLVVAAAAPRAQDVDKLFKAAVNTEMVDGNLPAAIEQYKKVAQTGTRALAAQALVRMAECYQKLGDAESRKIYERLVRDYADQKESAAIARARLGDERIDTPKTMALRKVWSGPNISSDECGISSDGRYITCPAWETGDLGIHDMATGTDRLLTTNNWAGNQYAHNSAISKDGKQVAYAWFNGKDRYELRLTGLQPSDTRPRTILDNEDIDYIVPSDWSPDGESVVVRIFRKDRTAQIGLVGVKDRSLRVLKTIDWSSAVGLFLSPDGRYIGFDMTADETNRNERDVFVLAVDGSRETPVVVHPGRDLMMGWSPDGRYLLFASDRSGTAGLWSLPISAGRPMGSPALVTSDIAPASLGVSRSGALFVVAQVGILDVSIAAIDLEGGKLMGAPTSAVRSFVGRNVQPAWSRDGKHLAYVSLRGGSSRNRVIVIRSLETGDTRELNVAMGYFGPIHWAPDGRSFLVKGENLKGVRGVYQIDALTGQATRLPFEDGPCAGAPEWSPDGTKVYFFGGTECPNREGSVFLEGDTKTGTQREIARGPGPQVWKLSPDGRLLAGIRLQGEAADRAIVLIPVSGGASRELPRLNEGRSVLSAGFSWAPDGRHLIVNAQAQGEPQVFVVPIDGSAARKLEGDDPHPVLRAITVHPTGRQIAYATGEYKAEVWVLENFLPATAK
jgi:Tol biopolymer transport system component